MSGWRAEFTDLRAWQAACDVAEDVYRLTRTYPSPERNGMAGQMRRAAVSISSRIAEGCARRHPRDRGRIYETARSSGEELRSLLILSRRFGFVSGPAFEAAMARLDDACRQVAGLIEAAGDWVR